MKNGTLNKFIPPPGGRVHILTVPVILDRPWNEAIRAASPDTPNNYNIWKVGDLYPPTGTGTKKTEIVLFNFFGVNRGDLKSVLAWAKKFRLKRTNPRQVFAIGEHEPELFFKLGMNPVYVMATQECTFENSQQMCGVWWIVTKREASVCCSYGPGNLCAWFAFVQE